MLSDAEIEALAERRRICREGRFVPLGVEIAVPVVEEKHGSVRMQDHPHAAMRLGELFGQHQCDRAVALALAGRIDRQQPEGGLLAIEEIDADGADQGAVAVQAERLVALRRLVRMVGAIVQFRQVLGEDRPLPDGMVARPFRAALGGP